MSTQDKNTKVAQKVKDHNTKVGNSHNSTTTTNNPERKDQDRRPTETEPQKMTGNNKNNPDKNQDKTNKKTVLSNLNRK